MSPHPFAPSLQQIFNATFSQDEQPMYESAFRPLVEAGGSIQRGSIAYLTANKPGGTGAIDPLKDAVAS